MQRFYGEMSWGFLDFLNWNIVDVQYCMSEVYNILITIFKGYIAFIVAIKYWLYSLCYIIYPHSLFILCIELAKMFVQIFL